MDNDRRARRTNSRTNRHAPANETEPPSWPNRLNAVAAARVGDAAC